jgi:hypothetical protein
MVNIICFHFLHSKTAVERINMPPVAEVFGAKKGEGFAVHSGETTQPGRWWLAAQRGDMRVMFPSNAD